MLIGNDYTAPFYAHNKSSACARGCDGHNKTQHAHLTTKRRSGQIGQRTAIVLCLACMELHPLNCLAGCLVKIECNNSNCFSVQTLEKDA